jgi:hypothetical protein
MPGWPAWASWSFKEKFLPEEVHNHSDGFKECKDFLSKFPHQKGLPCYVTVERLCLMIGMMLRDLGMIGYMKTTPDLIQLDDIPSHVVESVHPPELREEFDETVVGPVVQFLKTAMAPANKGDSDGNDGNAKAGPSKEIRPVVLPFYHLQLSDGFTEVEKKKSS